MDREKNTLTIGKNYSIQVSDEHSGTTEPLFDICLCGAKLFTVTKEAVVLIADVGDMISSSTEVSSKINIMNTTVIIEIVEDEISFKTSNQTINFKKQHWAGISNSLRIFTGL